MSASSCNQSIYFHLAVHVLNTLFRGSVSRACVLTHAINTSNKRMNGLEKLFIASLFSQPKLEMRNVTIRGRNLFIFSLFLVNRLSVHRVKKRKQWSTNENKQSTGLAFASGKTNTSDSKFYTVKRHTVTISQTQSVVFTKPFDKDLDIYHKKIFSAKRNSVNKHIFEIN